MLKLTLQIFGCWIFLATTVQSLLLELEGNSEYCLADLEIDHANSQGELKFKYTSLDEHIRLGILGGGRRESRLNFTLYSQPTSEQEGSIEKKTEAHSQDRFSHRLAGGSFAHKLEANRTYTMCFKSEKTVGRTTVHLKFDYEEEQQLSNPTKIGESLLGV